MIQISFTALAVGIGLSLAPGGGAAAQPDAQPARPLQLRSIMREMGENMRLITDAVSRGNWPLAERAALSIASHPTPPAHGKSPDSRVHRKRHGRIQKP